MSLRDGPTIFGNLRRSASMTSRVSSTESVVVVLVTDQHDRVVLARVANRLEVDLRHERTRRVDHAQTAPRALFAHLRRDAVRAEDHGRVVRNLVELVDEDRALLTERLDDEAIVDDLA